MAKENNYTNVVFAVKSKDYKKGLKDVQDTTKKSTSIMDKSVGGLKVGYLAVAAAIAGVIAAGKEFVNLAREQEMSERKLDAAIKASANVSASYAQEIKSFASELQNASIVGDEVSISVANVGISMGNLGEKSIKPFMQLVADMSAATGKDAAGLSRTLAKAFADPAKAMTKLESQGLKLTAAQKGYVQSLVENGKVQEAQLYLIKETNKGYEGQAQALADGSGALTQYSNAAGDVKEQIGFLIIDAILPLVKQMTNLAV